jgi:hypothetical protein
MESPLLAVDSAKTSAITMPEYIDNVKSTKCERYLIQIRDIAGFACREMATTICALDAIWRPAGDDACRRKATEF